MTLRKKNAEAAPVKKEKAPKTTEIVKKESSAPPTISAGTMFVQNPDVVEALSDSMDLPMIYASDGTHMCNGEDIGKTFTYFPVSQKIAYKMDPCDQSAEAKELVKWSEDGEVSFHGESLQDLLEEAKEEGYSDAKIKEYIVITVIVNDYDNSNIEIENNFAVFRIAPGSQWGIEGYRSIEKQIMRTAIVKSPPKARKIPDLAVDASAVEFSATAKIAKFGGGSFTKSVVTLAP